MNKWKVIGCMAIVICATGLFRETHAQCAYGVDVGGGNCIPPDIAGVPEYKGSNSHPAKPENPQAVPSTDVSSVYMSIYIVPDGRLAWTTGPAWINHSYPPELGVIHSGWAFCKDNQKGGGADHKNCVLLNFAHNSCVSYSFDSKGGEIHAATGLSPQRAASTALALCEKGGAKEDCALITDQPICSAYDKSNDQNNHGYIEGISPQAIHILRGKYEKDYTGWMNFAKTNYYQWDAE
jgi:hypothetical protein